MLTTQKVAGRGLKILANGVPVLAMLAHQAAKRPSGKVGHQYTPEHHPMTGTSPLREIGTDPCLVGAICHTQVVSLDYKNYLNWATSSAASLFPTTRSCSPLANGNKARLRTSPVAQKPEAVLGK